jgi:hypothetical protein
MADDETKTKMRKKWIKKKWLCFDVKTIGYYYLFILLVWCGVYYWARWVRKNTDKDGDDLAFWVLGGLLISLHQVEEYVFWGMVKGESYWFMNWLYRSGFYCSIKNSFKANQILPWVFVLGNLCILWPMGG